MAKHTRITLTVKPKQGEVVMTSLRIGEVLTGVAGELQTHLLGTGDSNGYLEMRLVDSTTAPPRQVPYIVGWKVELIDS